MPASRSMIALLVGTVAFFALWVIALKPGGSSGTKPSQSLGQFQSDINKAHQAVHTSNSSNAASGNEGTATRAPSAPAATSSSRASQAASGGAAPTSRSAAASPAQTTSQRHAASKAHSAAKPAPHLTPKVAAHSPAALARLSTVQKALSAHKVVAMLFFNPQGADDQAVKQELAAVPTHHGRVVKLTIPLSEAANFTPVTQQVPVNFSPTLVLIAPPGQAGEIIGFSDQFEIAQRVDDALAAK